MIYYFSAPSNYIKELEENNITAFLLSYTVDGKNMKQYKKYNNVIIDSGAFSIWNKGAKVNIRDYRNFCLSAQQLINKNWYIINLDVIPNTGANQKDINDVCKQSYENYLFLCEKLNNVLPVHHYGDDYKWMEKYLAHTDYVCVSPANDTHDDIKIAYLNEIFKKLPDNIKVHALGYTSPSGLKNYPFFSVDSISYKSADMFGNIMIYRPNKMNFKTIDIWEYNNAMKLGYSDRKNRNLAKKGVSFNINSINNLMKDINNLHSHKNFNYLKAQKTLF